MSARKIQPRFIRCLTGIVLAVISSSACAPDGEGATDAAANASALAAIAEEAWQRQLERNPTTRLWEGLPIETLPDLSYEAAEDDARFAESTLARLLAIDRSALSHDDDLTWLTLERSARMGIEGFQYFWYGNVLTPYSSPIANLRQLFGAMPLSDADEARRFLDVLGQVPGFVSQVHRIAQSQLEIGYVVPQANMPAVTGLVRAQVRPPGDGPFAVAEARLADLDEAARTEFQDEFERIVGEQVNPALETLATFLETEYGDQAPDAVGMAQYPEGDAVYRYLVRLFTTMDITPEEVQAIGYEMVGEMQTAMSEIQAAVGFEGTAQEFRAYVQSNPDFYPTTPEQVGQMIDAAADKFFARRDEFFARAPEAPYASRRLDPALEGSQTYGYYNPPAGADPTGYYNFNGSNLDQRTLLTLDGLAYHELFPGHHFQIMRVLEDETLPDIRRATMHTAYTEGWGSYSSYLGLEQGMLPDPLAQYGLYMLEIFLATRLVVDPGMNALGMSLEDARQFMRETTFESETQIGTESLRYSTDMPGQALGYQMGKRRLLELRAHAQERLGDRFDLRAFHEAVLSPGSLPMTVLAEHIDWWIEQQLAQ